MAPPFRTAKRWMTKRVTPDYTNQLDLFSEAPIETPAPVVSSPVGTSGARRPPRPQQLAFDVWEPLPPEGSPRAAAEPAPASTGAEGRTAQRAPEQTSIGQQDKTSPDLRTGERRGAPAGNFFDIEPEEKPSRDFRITEAHRIGQRRQGERQRQAMPLIAAPEEPEARHQTKEDDPGREERGDLFPERRRLAGRITE